MSILSGPAAVGGIPRNTPSAPGAESPARAPSSDLQSQGRNDNPPAAVTKTISPEAIAAALAAARSGWTDGKVQDAAAHVASNAASTRTTIPDGSGRVIATGTRDGVDISVVIESDGQIVTGYPANPSRHG